MCCNQLEMNSTVLVPPSTRQADSNAIHNNHHGSRRRTTQRFTAQTQYVRHLIMLLTVLKLIILLACLMVDSSISMQVQPLSERARQNLMHFRLLTHTLALVFFFQNGFGGNILALKPLRATVITTKTTTPILGKKT